MSPVLKIVFGLLAVAEAVRGVVEALAADYLDAVRGPALAVLFGFFAAGITRPVRGSAPWYLMWGAGLLAAGAAVLGLLG